MQPSSVDQFNLNTNFCLPQSVNRGNFLTSHRVRVKIMQPAQPIYATGCIPTPCAQDFSQILRVIESPLFDFSNFFIEPCGKF